MRSKKNSDRLPHFSCTNIKKSFFSLFSPIARKGVFVVGLLDDYQTWAEKRSSRKFIYLSYDKEKINYYFFDFLFNSFFFFFLLQPCSISI